MVKANRSLEAGDQVQVLNAALLERYSVIVQRSQRHTDKIWGQLLPAARQSRRAHLTTVCGPEHSSKRME